MKNLKLCMLFLIVFSCHNGFSAVYICGMHTNPHTGVSSKVCHTFFNHKCNEEGNFLDGVANLFPGGWTCYEGIAQKEDHNVHLISGNDGTFVFVGSERVQITSDAFLEFLKKLRQDTANMRVSDQMIQNQIDAFLDTDSGKVSDARLQQLSMDLRVPIEFEGSGNSRDELRRPKETPKVTPKPTSRPGWEPNVPPSGELAVGPPAGGGGHPNPTAPPAPGQPTDRSAGSGSQAPAGQQAAAVQVGSQPKGAPTLKNLQRRGVVMSDSMQRMVFNRENSRSMASYGLTKMTRDLNGNDVVYFVNPISYALLVPGNAGLQGYIVSGKSFQRIREY